MSPENESVSPYFNGLSMVLNELSPEGNGYSNTNSNNYRDTECSKDKLDYTIEKKMMFLIINTTYKYIQI